MSSEASADSAMGMSSLQWGSDGKKTVSGEMGTGGQRGDAKNFQ